MKIIGFSTIRTKNRVMAFKGTESVEAIMHCTYLLKPFLHRENMVSFSYTS